MRVLAGRYELTAFVGRGGMGEVWAGRDRVIGRRVAVKLLPHGQDDPGGAELFFREARIAGGLNHRGVVIVHDMGQDPADGTLFLVMEYVEGRDLAAVLRQDGLPPVPVAVEWAAQGAAALAAAHAAGVVHRDLKPANLMLTAGGEVKVLDFGIARYMSASAKSSKVMGTLAYMAPERFEEQSGDGRSDLYAFGCVLHELLTGAPPFEATGPVSLMTAHLSKAPVPPGKLRTDVPAALDALVLRLLAKSPEDRPVSAVEVHDALRTLHATPADVRTVPDLPARPPAGFGPAPDPVHGATTRTAMSPPRPLYPAVDDRPGTAGTDGKPQLLTRRSVLWLGLGATAVAATGVTAAVLTRDNNTDKPPTGRGSGDGGGGQASSGPRGWRYEAKISDPSAPVVSGGTLRFTDGETIYGLDALTGAERAQLDTKDEVYQLATADGMLYFADSKGKLHARSGSEKWVFTAGDVITGKPAVVDGTIYFGSIDKHVYAVHADTGTKKWSFATGDKVFCSPAVADGTLYIGLGGKEPGLYALDAVLGEKTWAFRDTYFTKTPAVSDGIVFATGSDDSLYALNTADGTGRWVVPLKRAAGTDAWFRPSPPVVASGTVYVGGGDNALHALVPKTGTERWSFDVNGPFLPSTPAVAGGMVYVADLNDPRGTVHAVDAASGSRRWSARTGARVRGEGAPNTPVVAGGLVYVTNESGVVAINATSGDFPA
ncbi:PQQ-binding-like beta-propeller repeat protein [Streptomyces sp. NPDC059153]|uniref:serine/threonine-protein kinase n=1 Tax=Streptomyces sp. NPDC059153 TaxID=3346743 RepID=UPI003677C3EE